MEPHVGRTTGSGWSHRWGVITWVDGVTDRVGSGVESGRVMAQVMGEFGSGVTGTGWCGGGVGSGGSDMYRKEPQVMGDHRYGAVTYSRAREHTGGIVITGNRIWLRCQR